MIGKKIAGVIGIVIFAITFAVGFGVSVTEIFNPQAASKLERLVDFVRYPIVVEGFTTHIGYIASLPLTLIGATVFRGGAQIACIFMSGLVAAQLLVMVGLNLP